MERLLINFSLCLSLFWMMMCCISVLEVTISQATFIISNQIWVAVLIILYVKKGET